jgi:hypothetical protein
MSKLKITPGIWVAEDIDVYIETHDENNFGPNIAQAYDGKDTHISNMDYEIARANAELIADAGTTYNQCQTLPSVLAEQNLKFIEDNTILMQENQFLRDKAATDEQTAGEIINGLKAQRDTLLEAAELLMSLIKPEVEGDRIWAYSTNNLDKGLMKTLKAIELTKR